MCRGRWDTGPTVPGFTYPAGSTPQSQEGNTTVSNPITRSDSWLVSIAELADGRLAGKAAAMPADEAWRLPTVAAAMEETHAAERRLDAALAAVRPALSPEHWEELDVAAHDYALSVKYQVFAQLVALGAGMAAGGPADWPRVIVQDERHPEGAGTPRDGVN